MFNEHKHNMKKIFILLFTQLALCCTSFAANYLTFTAEEDNSSFSIEDHNIKSKIFYSLDNGETWNQLTDEPVGLAKGDRALLKGEKPDSKVTTSYYSNFKMEGAIAASGSVMSLVDGDGESKTIPYDYCFCRLFQDCSSLTKAPELPATTLARACYLEMFKGCSSLTQTPELPATTLAYGCYYYMFSRCTSLTQAPELPVTQLEKNCYEGMFSKCTSLTQAPKLPATTLAKGCYANMFSECSSLTQAPELPATTVAELCYNSMFYMCNSLTQAPKLPATTLAGNCYADMFRGCTSLTEAPELPATTIAGGCYAHMFHGCSSLKKAPKLPVTTLEKNCYSYMFGGCSSLTEAPELPATTLATSCYSYMFHGCSSLTEAPELPATTLKDSCYEYMFCRCTELTKAPDLPATTLIGHCYWSMFEGCWRLTYIKVAFSDWGPSTTYRWTDYVAKNGTFVCPEELTLYYNGSHIPEGWTVNWLETRTEAVPAEEGLSVRTSGLTIFIGNANADIEVYEVGGKLIGKARTMSGEAQMTVPQSGIYLVKAGAQTRKVVL